MDFKEIVTNWVTEIQALSLSMPASHEIQALLLEKDREKFRKFIFQNCEIKSKKSDSEFTYVVPEKAYTKYCKYKDNLDRLEVACTILPRMFIVTLMCQYDAFIGNLVRFVLALKPEILNSSEKRLTFQQLINFKDMEAVKEYIINKEVETILRDSHEEQFKWFENKLGINLQSDEELLKTFYEITERRNVYTHNNGIINSSYIDNCRRLGCISEGKLGELLLMSPEYYNKAVNCIIEIGIKLTIVLWRKLIPEDMEKTENTINSLAYGLIYEKNYLLAIKIIKFALDNFKKFNASANRLMLVINLAQCYLWLGEVDETKRILDKEDWSLCSPDFLICKKVLERDFSGAVNILKRNNENIRKDYLLDWPIFKELREDKAFKEYFSSTFSMTLEEYAEQINPDFATAVIRLKKANS